MSKTLFWIYFLCLFVLNYGEDFQFADVSCPGKEEIRPCSCYVEGGESNVECTGIRTPRVLSEIFQRVPNWKFNTLSISGARLLYIPTSIFENSHFMHLNITDTILTALFDQPPKSDSLRRIFVVNSELLRGINWKWFSSLKLEVLSFQETRIRKIGKSFGNAMPKSLTYFGVTNSNITRLAHDAFGNLPNLESLTFRAGMLSKIEGLVFPKSIKYIDFSANRINSLSSRVFKDLPNLHFVVLIDNKLTTIPEEVFADIPLVFLTGNPINCNCNLKWLVTTGKKSKILTTKCASPDALKGKKIKDLSLSDFGYCAQ